MTKNISITLDQDLLECLDKLAEINDRTRSGMISYLIKQSYLKGTIYIDLNAQKVQELAEIYDRTRSGMISYLEDINTDLNAQED